MTPGLVTTSLTTLGYYTTAAAHLCTVRCYSPDLAIPQVASMCCLLSKAWKDSHLGKHQCGQAAQLWVVRAFQSRQLGRLKRMTPSVTRSNQTSGVLVAVTAVLACPKTLYGFCVVMPHVKNINCAVTECSVDICPVWYVIPICCTTIAPTVS